MFIVKPPMSALISASHLHPLDHVTVGFTMVTPQPMAHVYN